MAFPVSNELLNFLHKNSLLQADAWSWWHWRNNPEAELDDAFKRLIPFSEFRSLVAYRLRSAGEQTDILKGWTFANDLNIYTPKIGGGFRIQHGHSTWVMAEEIGDNFHVNQNVTIGVEKSGKPKIGHNVRVFTGAVVVGRITIGDNVTIAPNSFVNFDVPAGKKVFPARSVIV